MPVLHRDIESKSLLNLKKVGARLYVAHPTTAPWCVAYAVDDGPIKLWFRGDPVPPEFIEAAQNPAWLVVAHNDAFETAFEEQILAPQFNWPLVPIERHRCTMAMALASALPAGLDKLALAIGLPIRKDAEGTRLMRKMARPRKPHRDEDPNAGPYWHDGPENIEKLGAYCMRDVEVERLAFQRLPPLIDSEQELWVLDAKINARGFYTDGALLNAASHIAAGADEATQRELAEITNGALFSTDQVEALQAWLGEHGCVVKDIRKGTLAHALRRKDLDPAVRRVIELRRGAAHAAAGKVDTLRAWRGADGRVRGTLRFHGAGPGRWTGHGPQPQNFKRDSEDMEGKREAVAVGSLQHVAGLYAQPLEVVGDIARAMICAAPGHRLMIGDFSGVESRVTALVSGQTSKLEQWARFDATGDPKVEPYYLIGHACGLPEEIARDKGKVADLAFGYQGGVGAWNNLAPEDDASSEDDKKRYQRTWRNLNPETVRFWTTISRAAVRAVRKPGMTSTAKGLSLTYDGSMFLRIVLPSGRSLSYPFPRLMKKTTPWGGEQTVVIFKDNSGGKWADNNHGQGAYGGLWTENIVQAISRDLLAAAMQRLEAAGYSVVLHVHDEVICEVPIGFGSLDEFKRLLIELPGWAEGLPIAAKSREGDRFSKASKPKINNSVVPCSKGSDCNWPACSNDCVGRPGAGPIEIEVRNALDGLLDQDDSDDDDEAEIDADDEDTDSESPNPEHEFTPVDPEPVLAAVEPDDLQLRLQQALRELNEETRAPPKSPPRGNGAGNGQHQGNGAASTHDVDEDEEEEEEDGHSGGYPHGVQRGGQYVAVYVYQDHVGRNHTKVRKKAPRGGGRAQYPQSFWVNGKWVAKKPAGWRKVPYRLPEMLAALAATPDVDVYIPEGEKDAESVHALGLIATTSSEGATPLKAKISKWTPELNKWFDGVQRGYILEDNDEPGRKFAREKAQALAGIVPDVRIVSFPDVPIGEDVTWWLKDGGHTKDELLERCKAAPSWQHAGALDSVCASEVDMLAIDWLWRNRFAVGKIGIIAGLPDEGKGQILCYVAARVTKGGEWPMAEGICPRGGVLILSAEEDPSTNLVPRLVAAGADLSRVHFIKMVRDRDEKSGQERERMFSLVTDLPKLRHLIAEVGDVKALFIDPVSAYLGVGQVDSYRDTDVRAVLGPLKELAEELKVAVLAIMHFNKKVDITNALLRVSNSMAFVGLARHAYGVIADPENQRKLFVRAKNNDAADSDNQTLAFHFEVREVGYDAALDKAIRAPFIVWEPGYVDITATEAMQAASENKSPGDRDQAKRFLLDQLAGGREVSAADMKEAADAAGYSVRTIRRAKADLIKEGRDIRIEKEAGRMEGKWFWQLKS